MFLAGTNYTVIYWSIQGKLKQVWGSDEFKLYLLIVMVLTIWVTLTVLVRTDAGLEEAFRMSLFQIVSVITTTGFITADYTSWGTNMTMLFFILLFLGACAGSTSGGIKLVRHLVFFKNSVLEFKRILHPRAIVPLKISGQVVAPRIMTHILVFFIIVFNFVCNWFGDCFMDGLGFSTSIGAVATSLGNVGPGIGRVGRLIILRGCRGGKVVFDVFDVVG